MLVTGLTHSHDGLISFHKHLFPSLKSDLHCRNKFLSSGMMTLFILPSVSSAGNRLFFFLHSILVCLKPQAEGKGSWCWKPPMPFYLVSTWTYIPSFSCLLIMAVQKDVEISTRLSAPVATRRSQNRCFPASVYWVVPGWMPGTH